jgi:hypothetical protein
MKNIDTFLSEIDWKKWHESHKLFAILDCAHLPEEMWRPLHALDASVRRPLFEGTPDEGLSSVEPVLLDAFNPSTPRLMPWLIEQEKASPSVLWLASPQPIDGVQKHIAPLLSADLPDAPDSVLRFYDPGVMNKLMQVCTSEQKARFFVGVDQWWAWNKRTGQRYGFARPQTDVRPAAQCQLSASQMERFSQLDIADFVHDTQTDIVNNKSTLTYAKDLSNHALAQQVAHQIHQAMAYGFEAEENIQMYLQCVAKHLGWDFAEHGQHPALIASLKDADRDEDEKLERLQSYCASL